jgi:glutamate:GABA antiporter
VTPTSVSDLPVEPAAEKGRLKRELGFFDLTLIYIAATLSLRWVATAAAAGPSSIVIWVFACFGFFVPLAASVLELSSRYPQEGGVYVWTQRAFGDFSGFLAAWTYWMSNLPYFPAVLYFGAGSLLAAFPHGQRWSNTSGYYLGFALVCMALITLLNVIGLKFGKWLNSFGAIGSWVPVVLLVILAAISLSRFGSATSFTAATMRPHLGLKNAMFWATIFSAFAGCETGSFMSEEIKNARRLIPRALALSGVVLVFSYIAGTVGLLIAMPSQSISGVGGFANAIQLMCTRLGLPWAASAIALLVVASSIGGAAVYLSTTSRLPFVVGIDRYLPSAFGRVHKQWGTPWVAITIYGGAGMLCTLLSQAGSSVEGAYELLVSMSIITTFIPFLFLFLAMIRVQREPAPAGIMRVPGGKPVAIALGSLGFATTLLTILLSAMPASDEPHKALVIAKVLGATLLLVGAGIVVFWSARWRRKS